MHAQNRFRGSDGTSRRNLSDEEVLAELDRASRDLGPLLDLSAQLERVEYYVMTTTRLSLGSDAPLRPWLLNDQKH